MAKKKIKIEPSKYQKAIYDFILNKEGNLVVEAVAGSGKTTTIIESLKLIPQDKRVLFCAFNRDIALELKNRIKDHPNVTVTTTYSLGFRLCLINMGISPDVVVKEKYFGEFITNTHKYTTNSKFSLKKKWQLYTNNIKNLLRYSRLNLVSTTEEIIQISKYYEVSIISDEANVVEKLIAWGTENRETIDYEDMVCYPNNLKFDFSAYSTYDFIFVDEAQDLSTAQRELILKCGYEGTRFIFVGDSKQAIYGFGAADPNSFKKLKEIPNTSILPLSVCYRCPKSIVNYVKGLVPNIEYSEDSIEGDIKYNKLLSDVSDGDVILCRNNAPLMQIYNTYLRMGKKAYVLGREVGQSLISLITTYNEPILNANLEEKGLFSVLYKDYFEKRKEMMKTTGFDLLSCDESSELTSFLDKIESLKVLSEGLTTSAQLLARVDRVFSDTETDGIKLSTVHKAKGLEYNNVYIAKRELFSPNKKNLEWEKTQERNLEYVAYTRAKQKLCFIKDDEVGNRYSISLTEIQKKVDELYNPFRKISKLPISNDTASTVTGRTTPGVGIILNDDPAHLSASTRPLTAMFAKKKSRRKLI